MDKLESLLYRIEAILDEIKAYLIHNATEYRGVMPDRSLYSGFVKSRLELVEKYIEEFKAIEEDNE